jgi:hypothetical protein
MSEENLEQNNIEAIILDEPNYLKDIALKLEFKDFQVKVVLDLVLE